MAEVLDQVKAIEIDIFDSPFGLGGGGSEIGEWFVFHQPRDIPRNNCSGKFLSDCLNDVRQWHEENPEQGASQFGNEQKCSDNSESPGLGVRNQSYNHTNSRVSAFSLGSNCINSPDYIL
ncbi:MAG: hypothetical protein GDA48_17500 [Hormoscilla sp. GM102CHS1]|nr:hypothetical protein [Hormoscilla sp. GM102CHS1]